MKKTPGGIFYILSSSDATAADLQIYTSSTQRSLTLTAAGDAVFDGSITSKNPSKLAYTAIPTLTSSQIGYNIINTAFSSGNLTTTSTSWMSVTLQLGVYLIFGSIVTNGYSSGTGNGVIIQISTNSSAIMTNYFPMSSYSYVSCSVQTVANSSAGQVFSLLAWVNNATTPALAGNMQAIRIA